MVSSPGRLKSKTINLVFVGSAKHAALRSTDWLGRIQDDVSTCGLAYQ
jgi:hypothetical protein